MIHCVLEASQHFDLTALEMVANLSNSFSIPDVSIRAIDVRLAETKNEQLPANGFDASIVGWH